MKLVKNYECGSTIEGVVPQESTSPLPTHLRDERGVEVLVPPGLVTKNIVPHLLDRVDLRHSSPDHSRRF